MKATELRIGNKVYDTEGKENTVTIEALKYLLKYGGTNQCQVKPIPITEEWLERIGLTKQLGWSIVYEGEKFNRGSKSLEVSPNDIGTWYAYVRNFNQGEPDDFVLLRSDLMHVHQIQNLYHALTGEELEIK
jgi:hypothetical protein